MTFSVERMALYNLTHAEDVIQGLEQKDKWEPPDTASFDCMHYLGDAALDNCARTLQLKPKDRVLDIGSGFNSTGRYLSAHYGAFVTGIELQPRIHEIGQIVTAHAGQGQSVQSISTNFLTAPSALIADGSADHIVSFLCFLHIPSRSDLFHRAAKTLKPNGRIYIEDFYARQPLTSDDAQALHDIVSCPYLPSEEQYVADMKGAGFSDIVFVDMTEAWSAFVSTRAEAYHSKPDRGPDLDVFYGTVAALFKSGRLGGVRIHARTT